MRSMRDRCARSPPLYAFKTCLFICAWHAGSRATVARSTPADEDGGNGEIVYLDRQSVDCAAPCAIQSFKLVRPTLSTISYNYQCVCDATKIMSPVSPSPMYPASLYTLFDEGTSRDSGDTAWQTYYLDRHDVTCHASTALQSFALERDNTGKKIRYRYTCTPVSNMGTCRRVTSPLADAAGGHLLYLDRQNVACNSGEVMTRFHLMRRGDGDNVQYGYTCCSVPSGELRLQGCDHCYV